MELPALTGTDKQVAWATDIRTTAFATIDAALRSYVPDWEDETLIPVAHEVADEIRAAIAPHAESSWWIKNTNIQVPANKMSWLLKQAAKAKVA